MKMRTSIIRGEEVRMSEGVVMGSEMIDHPPVSGGMEEYCKELAMAKLGIEIRLERAKQQIQIAWNLIDDGAEIRAKSVLAKALDEWDSR